MYLLKKGLFVRMFSDDLWRQEVILADASRQRQRRLFSDDLQGFVIRYKTDLFLGTRSSENGGEGYAAAEVQAAGISDLRYTFPRLCTLLMRKAAKL